jgi:hypothetical protein
MTAARQDLAHLGPLRVMGGHPGLGDEHAQLVAKRDQPVHIRNAQPDGLLAQNRLSGTRCAFGPFDMQPVGQGHVDRIDLHRPAAPRSCHAPAGPARTPRRGRRLAGSRVASANKPRPPRGVDGGGHGLAGKSSEAPRTPQLKTELVMCSHKRAIARNEKGSMVQGPRTKKGRRDRQPPLLNPHARSAGSFRPLPGDDARHACRTRP